MHVSVPLSRLVANRRNPRRVKPEREAHRRLVASIRAHGLLEPLVVRPDENRYRVIAGNRRLAALRDVHRHDDPEIACEVRTVDNDTADALSLSENFAREGMHPLDEAEAFAKLASVDCKGVAAIAAEFGVSAGYVRQRMKLAMLAEPVKAAYRQGTIDTGTAEAFAAVPADRQLEVWEEVGGSPRHANHVRNIIANGWIDAAHALFDVNQLPEGAVSRDLFHERVLIERQAFFAAQAEALTVERERLIDDGWGEVVIAARDDVRDRLLSMATVDGEVDEATAAELAALDEQRTKLEAELDVLNEDDEAGIEALSDRLDELDRQAQDVLDAAPRHYSEAVKATATVFLIADPDGKVRRELRTPRRRAHASGNGHPSGDCGGSAGNGLPQAPPVAPTSDDLSDRQLASTFTHQALGVREALLQDPGAGARKRVLALILHERVRAEALSIRHDANSTTLHADKAEGFTSTALEALRQRRAEVDPFQENIPPEDHEAYARLRDVPDAQLNALIDLLTVECIAAHLHRRTELVAVLANELGVNVRRDWRPDAGWLNSFKKVQLAYLLGELRGPAHGSAAERRKKSELVAELATLFTDAAEGRLDDPRLAERVNAWLPVNLRRGADEAEADA